MTKFLYLALNLGSILIPFIFSFHPKIRFDKTWSAFWPAVLIVAGAFIAWDVAFTSMGIWGFDPRYLIGVDILGLPIEEWLFFICIPYACVFTYRALGVIIEKDVFAKATRPITISLIIGLTVVGAFNISNWYTATTYGLLVAVLVALHFMVKPQWLGRFYLSYVAILFPFFLVNGVLTGSGITDQVVWYNDAENLGIRMGTIPVEDAFYAMAMLILVVWIYEELLSRRPHLS